jgi:hypothetical protein
MLPVKRDGLKSLSLSLQEIVRSNKNGNNGIRKPGNQE